MLVDMKTTHSSSTSADAVPTDPIDESHPRHIGAQHKTTDEDTADNTIKHTQSPFRPIFGFMCFLPRGNQLLFSLALSPISSSFPCSGFLTTCIPVKLPPLPFFFLSAVFFS